MSVLRLGMTGTLVGKVHQRLVECGASIPPSELAAQRYGPATIDAVKAFQREQGLATDGVVGPLTLHRLDHPGTAGMFTVPGWRCEPSQIRPQVRPVVVAAVADIGRRESPDGSNDGPDLTKFLTGGEPWCAMALSQWFSLAPGGSPFGRISLCFALYQWAVRHVRVLASEVPPEPGDVWIALRKAEEGQQPRGHVALIVHRLDDGRLCTVGGNEANAVRGRIRNRHDASAILRPVAVV